MIIVGIDPGFADMGYGVVEAVNNKYRAVDYGVLRTKKTESIPDRLRQIYDGTAALLEKYKPDCVSVEELFYFRNQTSVIPVAEARGVIILAAVKNCKNLFEFTPLQVKQAITGFGRADKPQMQQMVKILLNLKEIPKPDDAADALAIALTCAQTQKMSGLFRA